MLQIEKYTTQHYRLWNDFLSHARNATFLFHRNYLDYHSQRFHDHSLIIYKNNTPIALLPAHIHNKQFCSHLGLTYGGYIYTNKMTATLMLQMFEETIHYIQTNTDAETFIYLPIPYIYPDIPSQEDLYALFRHNATLIARKISTVIQQDKPLGLSELRKRKLKKAEKQNLTIISDNNYPAFWNILETNLKTKYNTTPVHSLSEITLLYQRFPNNIRLYRVTTNNETVAGCVLYITKNVTHVQYIASTPEGRALCAVDYLLNHLIYNEYARKTRYFDLGTSVEDGGKVLNEGLIFQKEGFGGRAVTYDTYKLDLK